MPTREDCPALRDLSEDEVAAIMEHEQIPELRATEFGRHRVGSDEGRFRLRRLVLDGIQLAEHRGDGQRAAGLKRILRHVGRNHPVPSRPGSTGRALCR